MRAIGFSKQLPISAAGALLSIDVPKPELSSPKDLLVEVKGVSVNPVDTKVRGSIAAFAPKDGENKIIGYDASGVVKEVGAEVKNFKVGDEVFYSGDILKQGTNAELHVVDERIVGKKPKSLDFAESAGFPLVSITAWELLFDAFRLQPTPAGDEGGATGKVFSGKGDDLLIIGGAGGVGSILIQLAKQLTGLNVVATASRPETIEWCKKMGADHVINHRESIADQLKSLNITPKYVASLTQTATHFSTIVDVIKPRGHVAIIDDPATLDINSGKLKALTFSWEFMFSRAWFQTEDLDQQSKLLNEVSKMIDEKKLISIVTGRGGKLTVESLTAAHAAQESGSSIGKFVLEGI